MFKFFDWIGFQFKLVLLQVFVLLVVVLAVGITSYSIFTSFVQLSASENAIDFHRVLEILIDKQSGELSESALIVAKNPETIYALKTNQLNLLNGILNTSIIGATDILMVVDTKGKVFASNNNPLNTGYGISIKDLIAKSIETNLKISSMEVLTKQDLLNQGEVIYNKVKMTKKPTTGSKQNFKVKDIEEEALINTVVVPVYDSKTNKVVGAVVSASLMNNNFNLIDTAKNKKEGVDFTIFKDDLRIATTVPAKQGGRAIGTLLSEPVVDKVLIDGKAFSGKAMVAGIPYQAYYSPIKNHKDQIVGSLFAAVSEQKMINTINTQFLKGFLISIVCILLLTIPVLLFFAAKLVGPLKEMITASEKMANGELNQDYKVLETNDELGRLSKSFRKMSDSMRNLVIQIKQKSEEVENSSKELQLIAESSSHIVNQVTKTIEQMAIESQSQANDVSVSNNSIIEISKISNASVENISCGKNDVEITMSKIKDIKDNTKGLAIQINNLGFLGQQIGKIVELITNIASQTNLLALNAAIESARAGEHGRGFAVVAQEVKSLADESAKAASQIKDMIEQIQIESSKAVQSTELSVIMVDEGVEAVNNVKNIFEVIEKSAKDSEEKTNTVSISMESISSVVEQSAAANQEISASMQEQNSSMEELFMNANVLADLTKELNNTVSAFKL